MGKNLQGVSAQEAARWLARHDRGLTDIEKQEFAHWRAADVQNALYYDRLTLAWNNFDAVKAMPELSELARSLDEETRFRPLAKRRTKRAWFLSSLAVAAALMLVARVWRGRPSGAAANQTSYHVSPNTDRRIALPDSSLAELRGNSEIQTEFTAAERRVKLLRGEGYFTVTKNPARPFIVRAGFVSVRAVGTAFSVQILPTGVEVIVKEGKISLSEGPPTTDAASVQSRAVGSAPMVFAGHRAVIKLGRTATSDEVEVAAITPAEIDEALSWQNTWLIFNRTPLPEALAAFNRYGADQLILVDTSISSRRLDGKFRADHVDSFVRLIEQTMHVRAERRDGRKILLVPSP